MNGPYHCLKDSNGSLVHTTVALTPEESMSLALEMDNLMIELTNNARRARGKAPIPIKTAESLIADGFTVVEVELKEVPKCTS